MFKDQWRSTGSLHLEAKPQETHNPIILRSS